MKKYLGLVCLLFATTLHADTVWDVMKKREDLSLFCLAMHLAKAEGIAQANEFTPVYGLYVPVIIFAPNNEAWVKAGFPEEKMKAIAAQEGFIEGGPEEARSKTLRTLLKQHVCFKANEPANALRPEYERAVGPKLKVVKEKIQAFSTKANIVVPDLKGDNGMVHVIDAILDTEPDEKL